ncbi:transposase [Bradyrhizobium sp. UFLA01-814]|uniref:IS66 family transposase n=1 Tax=Bradyrhizobium sp. UFLA01-814 TaxID=3023480 RepID=UPI00398A5AF8
MAQEPLRAPTADDPGCTARVLRRDADAGARCRRHRTRICQFWAYAIDDRPWGGPSPPAVANVFANGRGMEVIARQLMGFSGILQVDGYAAYKPLARDHGDAIELAFCLAHARRKFVEVYIRRPSRRSLAK